MTLLEDLELEKVIKSSSTRNWYYCWGPHESTLESLGIKDVVAKSTGTSNPHNMLKATLNAFKISESPKTVAAKRSKINDITSNKNN